MINENIYKNTNDKSAVERAIWVINTMKSRGFVGDANYTGVYDDDDNEWDNEADASCDSWFLNNKRWLKKNGISVCHGLTKIVLVDQHNPDWVIKIGANNYPGSNRKIHNDFCKIEADIYAEACGRNLSKFFAKTFELMDMNDNRVVCLQESVVCDTEANENLIYDFSCSSGRDVEDTEDYVEAFVGYFPELNEFIDDTCIDDMHAGNWGVTKDGRTVMIDFSGCDDTEEDEPGDLVAWSVRNFNEERRMMKYTFIQAVSEYSENNVYGTMEIEVSKTSPCFVGVFRINDIPASIEEFGKTKSGRTTYPENTAMRCPYRHWERYDDLNEKAMQKYGLTIAGYNCICDLLKTALDIGPCNACRER